MKEEDLYEPVANFVKNEFNCFYVGIEKGTKLGIIDVVGLRHVMGDYGGSTEVIAVEVKPENITFLKSTGQAHAYSVMANRCYLAILKPYGRKLTQDQKDIAAQLQVGLIVIGKQKECRIVVSSPDQHPIDSHRLELIGKCGFVQCVICGTFFEDKDMRTLRERSNITHAIRDDKNFQYWLHNLNKQRGRKDRKYIYDRRYICKDCVQVFSGLCIKSIS